MKKSLWILGAALCCGVAFVACDDDDEAQAAVGILSATVTPAGSLISYNCAPNGMVLENTTDSVQWDVSDAALANAVVKATPTLGCTVSYNGQAISEAGVTINVTSPVTLQVSDAAGTTVTYTLNVVRATTASGDAVAIKSSSFQGFPASASLLDWDMAYFKDKFYAIVTSLDGTMENYQLFSSVDGLNWTEVAYQTSLAGTSVPDSIGGYVIGGEGARLAVFNDRMYVLGGARTKGYDKYGNAAETGTDWFGNVTPSLSVWRSYSTSDGMTFECDTVGMTYSVVGDTASHAYSQLACTAMNVAELNGRLYMQGAYAPSFGSWQSAQKYAYTENGKDWFELNPEAVDDRNVKGILCGAFFAFKGKLWAIGGFTSFISASWMTNAIYSSTDGETWTKEADLPESMTNMLSMKVVAGENVAYMFGGEVYGEGGAEFAAQQIYRSEDSVNWEAVEAPASFTARRNARAMMVGNVAWVFGGNTSNASGNYAYPADGDTYVYDTWAVLMQ